MIKRFFSVSELTKLLSRQFREDITQRDIFEMVSRGELRIARWFDGCLLTMTSRVDSDDLIVRRPPVYLRGYLEVPRCNISPSGLANVTDAEIAFKRVLEIIEYGGPSTPAPVDLTSTADFYGEALFDEFGDYEPHYLGASPDDLVIPAADVYALSRSHIPDNARTAQAPMVEASSPDAGSRQSETREVRKRAVAPSTLPRQDPAPDPTDLSQNALLPMKRVEALVGLKKSSIYNKLADGSFPKPHRSGARCTRWRAGDINAWLIEQARSSTKGNSDVMA